MGWPPVWGLLRGGEYSDSRTRAALGVIGVVLFIVAFIPGLSVLVQLVVLIAAAIIGITTATATDRGGLAAWWYQPVAFPWLAFVVLGAVSFVLGIGGFLFGPVLLVPAALASVAWVPLVLRWIAYRRRTAARRTFKPQPLTQARSDALQLLEDDPALFMRRQAAAAGHGVYLGTGGDHWVFSAPQHTVMVLGPPRSGKTSAIVIPTILCANGPLLCTSTKTDVLADTIGVRSKLGTCWLFDPTGTVALPEGARKLAWSPLWGCEDWDRARDRAHAMVGAAAPARGVEGESHWTERAEALLGPLLHAASTAGQEMAVLVEWINARELQLPRDVLAERGSRQAASSLAGMAQTHLREMSSIWSTAAGVVSAYQSEGALATTKLGRGESPFDADAFVRGNDSIYVAAGSDVQRMVAPLVVGLIDDVRRATYRASGAGQLPVPVLLALDEVRNVAPIRDLPSIVSEAGSQGLVVLACFQDLSQAWERWPAAAGGFMSLFNTNVVLRGIKERSTLELVSSLFGEHEVEVRSRNEPDVGMIQVLAAMAAKQPVPPRSLGFSVRKERRVPIDAVSRGYPGQAIVLAGAEAPEWVHLTPSYGSSPWQEIMASDPGPEVPPEWRIYDGPA